MKRISALLLAALLLFILAACGEDSGKHDKTFTIIVGGEDVWTPFDGNSAITFENEKDDIIELTSEGGKAAFKGLVAGESVITAKKGEESKTALVKVVSAAQGSEGKPNGGKLTEAFFNPPNAGYLKLTEKEDGEIYRHVTVALLDGNYSLMTENVWDGGRIEKEHTSAETKTHYVGGDDGVWYINQDYDGTLTEDKLVRELTVWLDTFYEETEHDGYSLRIKTHYVGMETLCNVACDVYEIKDNGFGVYKKFWIDPQNGATLKYIEKGDGKDYEFELTQYSLLGPLWNNALRAEPYSSARRP